MSLGSMHGRAGHEVVFPTYRDHMTRMIRDMRIFPLLHPLVLTCFLCAKA